MRRGRRPDPEWGERVAAAVVLKGGDSLDLHSLRAWAKDFLAPHKLPSRLLVLDALPRNAMGKTMKPAIATLFQTAHSAKAMTAQEDTMANEAVIRPVPATHTKLSRQQITGFWGAWTGWTLDGMDSVIYALVLSPALTELLPKSGYIKPLLPMSGLPDRSCLHSSWWDGDCR
jgi:hypothetical protein